MKIRKSKRREIKQRKPRPIYEALDVFDLRDLQAFRTILMVMEQNELTIDQVIRYTWFQTAGQAAPLKRYCPDCGKIMALSQVNASKCTQVGGGLKSQWHCVDDLCGYSEYSRKTIPDQIHKLRKNAFPFLAEDKKAEREALEWEIANYLKLPILNMCPQCREQMALYKINTPVGKANIHGYKSVWLCECGHEEYSTNTIREEATRLRRI